MTSARQSAGEQMAATWGVEEELAYAIHCAIIDYARTDQWPILADDLPAAEWIAEHVIRRWAPPGNGCVPRGR